MRVAVPSFVLLALLTVAVGVGNGGYAKFALVGAGAALTGALFLLAAHRRAATSGERHGAIAAVTLGILLLLALTAYIFHTDVRTKYEPSEASEWALFLLGMAVLFGVWEVASMATVVPLMIWGAVLVTTGLVLQLVVPDPHSARSVSEIVPEPVYLAGILALTAAWLGWTRDRGTRPILLEIAVVLGLPGLQFLVLTVDPVRTLLLAGGVLAMVVLDALRAIAPYPLSRTAHTVSLAARILAPVMVPGTALLCWLLARPPHIDGGSTDHSVLGAELLTAGGPWQRSVLDLAGMALGVALALTLGLLLTRLVLRSLPVRAIVAVARGHLWGGARFRPGRWDQGDSGGTLSLSASGNPVEPVDLMTVGLGVVVVGQLLLAVFARLLPWVPADLRVLPIASDGASFLVAVLAVGLALARGLDARPPAGPEAPPWPERDPDSAPRRTQAARQ